jgi:DNA modification methylase
MAQRVSDAGRLTLEVEYLPPSSLIPDPKNVRRHSTKQIGKLSSGMGEYGFTCPIVIDETGRILAGHARHKAAKQMGLERVPCVRLTHLTADQKKAFAIADNKMSDLSAFDDDALRAVLKELEAVNFNMELTGLCTAEIDVLFDGGGTKTVRDPIDEFEDSDFGQSAVSQLGDLWRLGHHRLLCGSALEPTCYEQLLGEDRAQLIFTDPPYNVPIAGNVSGLGRKRHAEFAMGSGEMSEPEFGTFLVTSLSLMMRFSADGSIHYICMDWRHIGTLLAAAAGVYAEVKNLCVWNKTNAGMGSLYRSQHELVAVFKNGKAPHINNVELGKHGRYRTNVWDYPGANSFGATRDANLADHPTVKPVGLVADAIRDCSKRGAIVLDPFAGSGTTILAAERTGRRAAAIELEPHYVDVAIRRWQRLTGKAAALAADGRSFHQVQQDRDNATAGDLREAG